MGRDDYRISRASRVALQFLLLDYFPLFGGPMKLDDRNCRSPVLELFHPIAQGAHWSSDQDWAISPDLTKPGDESNELYRLSEAHLI